MKFARVTTFGVLALTLLGCQRSAPPAVVPAANPPVSSPVAEFSLRMIPAEETTAQSVLDELRIQSFAFDFKTPLNHRATFWREVWRDGKLDQSLSEGFYVQRTKERPLFGRVFFSFMDGQSMNATKSRWSIQAETYQQERTPGQPPVGQGMTGGLRWVDDPLKGDGMIMQSGNSPRIKSPVERGRTYTLHVIGASRGEPISIPEDVEPAELASKIPVAIFLRTRIERIPTKLLGDGGVYGRTSIPPEPLKD